MAVTYKGQEYVTAEEAAAMRGVTRQSIYLLQKRQAFGVSYVYDAGTMRPRQTSDGKREVWLLKSAVDEYQPRKPGPKPETAKRTRRLHGRQTSEPETPTD